MVVPQVNREEVYDSITLNGAGALRFGPVLTS